MAIISPLTGWLGGDIFTRVCMCVCCSSPTVLEALDKTLINLLCHLSSTSPEEIQSKLIVTSYVVSSERVVLALGYVMLASFTGPSPSFSGTRGTGYSFIHISMRPRPCIHSAMIKGGVSFGELLIWTLKHS